MKKAIAHATAFSSFVLNLYFEKSTFGAVVFSALPLKYSSR
jgi:hypothetical protein